MDEEIVLRLPQDINKLCRTCLTITENILCHNILLIENNNTTLAAEMLQTCALANIFTEDDLPKSICEDCAQKLEIAYNFKLQCQQTEKSIREILNLTADSTKETKETKKSKMDAPELFKTEISNLNTNISEDTQISVKGVTLYENNSNTNFIDNSVEFTEESVLKLEILLEDKAITSDIPSFSALSSQSSESSSQNGVLNLVEERKHVQNSSKNNLETDEINSLIQERKLYSNAISFEGSNAFIKKETFSEDETLGEHVCEYCYMSFTNYDSLINHLQVCESASNNSVLDKLFKLENESMDNVEFYEEDANENFPPYECKTCGIYFKSKYARNGHMSTHGTNHEFDTQGPQLRCDLCNKVYSSEAKLATHFQRHAVGLRNETSESTKPDTASEIDEQLCTDSEEHSNDRVKKSAKPGDVKCEVCHSGFLDEINLVRHLKKHGMQISVCKICLRRFDTALKLKEHMKSHWTNHEGKVYKCPICKEQFPSAITLRNHAIAHLDENYECKKCKRAFNNKFSYEKHMKQHSEPRFLCSQCGKQYFSSVTLACHIRSHNNEKPFVCTFCKKGFSSRATLSVHKRIHSSFKPYICNYCGYSCRQSGDLAMHTRTHTGERPYKCSFPNCDRKFTTSSQRKEHYRRHTNERNHKCPVCQKAFLESKTLKVHMLTHTGEKPHTCDVCGKRFRRTHHLSNHMKGHKDNLKL